MEKASIPHKTVLKLNNSALLVDNRLVDGDVNATVISTFSNMGAASFQKLFEELDKLSPNNRASTRDVLQRKKEIEHCILHIRGGIRRGLSRAASLQQEIGVMQKYMSQIEANKDFIYTVNEHKIMKHNLEPGVHVTNCLNCNITCQDRSSDSTMGIFESGVFD